ncbi:Flagellar motor protein MotB [Flavobacterium sp. 9AF]|uniref:OmpA family protein n=1 Tax=Flavobacterium sp. 9AF TaxID=2653142 RepID=UPI0012EFA256|nr:OmpA family protein [Flavobacterium sp. 9AF]VXC16740.1 Flagellar motor protein MotB [Flavobacterium sp. 9AF]
MKKIIFIYIITTFSLFAQNNELKKADKYFKIASFAKAAEAYSSIIENGNKSVAVLKKAADSYYYISDFDHAASLYKTLIEKNRETIDEQYLFRYAQALKAKGNLEESNKWMKEYEKEIPETIYKANIEKLENIKKQGEKFAIKNAPINTKFSDFGPAFYKEQLVFSSPSNSNGLFSKKYNWNKQPYLDLYVTHITNNELDSIKNPFSKELNTKLHEAGVTFTNDGNRIYFTRNTSENAKRSKDKDKVTHLSIFTAELKDGKWTNIQSLPFNGLDYSTMHPSLNKENNRLYFSSDMPGTIGSFDLFYVDIDTNGNFGKPINLGTEINTKNREQFPFISDENKLFFASDGHPGFGLLDVFMSEYKNDIFSKPLNLGLPVNTHYDDFSFIYNDSSQRGFFASNRDNGIGDDDIYSFLQTAPLKDFQYYIKGIVIDEETNENIDQVTVFLFNDKEENIGEKTISKDENFYFDVRPGSYKISTYHPDYIPAEKTVTILDNGNSETKEIIKMKRIPKTFLEELIAEEGDPKVITDNGVLMFDLPEILFDFDKFNIRGDAQVHLNQLVDKLNRYPLINIAIGSHTDNRGTEEYNKQLSHDRANATRNYLIEKGIAPSRITAEGFGESKPKVDCINHECSDEEHQMNRRSEFVIQVKQE